jgi:hypothetical protein
MLQTNGFCCCFGPYKSYGRDELGVQEHLCNKDLNQVPEGGNGKNPTLDPRDNGERPSELEFLLPVSRELAEFLRVETSFGNRDVQYGAVLPHQYPQPLTWDADFLFSGKLLPLLRLEELHHAQTP